MSRQDGFRAMEHDRASFFFMISGSYTKSQEVQSHLSYFNVAIQEE